MVCQPENVEAVTLNSNHPLVATFSSMDPANLVFHSHAGFLLHSATSHKVHVRSFADTLHCFYVFIFQKFVLQYVMGHQSGDRLAVTDDASSMVTLIYSVYGLLCNGGTAVLFDSSLRSSSPGAHGVFGSSCLCNYTLGKIWQ